MSEPTNPIFEEEKEFLERKKLEYERALRGDVAHIKDQTVHVGRLALAGAGVASGIWLLSKVFGGKKKPKRKPRPATNDYPDDYGDYRNTPFYDEPGDYADEPRDWPGPDAYYDDDEEAGERFGGQTDAGAGTVYHTDSGYESDENFDGTAPAEEPETRATAADDDNGLGVYPDFPAHSAPNHGGSPSPERRFRSDEHSHPTANDLPYDDSRRLAHSESFDEAPSEPPAVPVAEGAPRQSAARFAGKALMSFLQSDTGRVLIAQAAAVGMALVTKAVKNALPSEEAKTAKTSDLATPTVAAGAQAPPQPATRPVLHSPVPDASALDPDDAPSRQREPLA